MVEFKRLTLDDVDIYQSVVRVFRNQEVSQGKATAFLSDPSHIVYAAHDNRKAAGYILAYRLNRMDNGHDMMTIFHLFVNEAYRRQGIGRKLLNMTLDYAREEKLHYAFLITQNDNAAANALYRSCGGYNHPKDKEVYFWYITGRPVTDDADSAPIEQL